MSFWLPRVTHRIKCDLPGSHRADDRSPMMVVEYDGPFHVDARQQELNRIKNALLREPGLGLLRINDRHVTKSYRGMSVLRWIIEVTELMKVFDEGQRSGEIPLDESFDPSSFDSIGDGPRFPYWLSAPATQSFHAFFKTLDPVTPHGWSPSARTRLRVQRAHDVCSQIIGEVSAQR